MPTLAIKQNARGFVVQLLQQQLNRADASAQLEEDGIFGKETVRTLQTFQQRHSLPPTGEATAAVWEALQYAWPHPFYRALSLTMNFEGTRFGGCVGDFDGCILTFGAIGFNFKYGSAQRLLRAFRGEAADWFTTDVGEMLAAHLDTTTSPTEWRSLLLTKGAPQPEVRDWFAAAGKDDRMIHTQLEDAWKNIWQPAVKKCWEVLHIVSERGLACVFDTYVNNGGIKKASEARIVELIDRPEEERIRKVCTEAWTTCNPRWREHVENRKRTFIQPEAMPNRTRCRIDWYGFDTPPEGFE